jgi:hypothetical protein
MVPTNRVSHGMIDSLTVHSIYMVPYVYIMWHIVPISLVIAVDSIYRGCNQRSIR